MTQSQQPSSELFARIHGYLSAQESGQASPQDDEAFETLICENQDACDLYIRYLMATVDLRAWAAQEEAAGEEGSGRVASGQWPVASESSIASRNPEIPKSQIPNLPSLAPNLQSPACIVLDDSPYPSPLASLPFYISHPFVFSNLFALLVIGLGALAAWFYQIDIPQQVAQTDRQNVSLHNNAEAEKFEIVGRVTGMVDVKWADINTSTEHGNNVPLGRKYALSFGLMEITYDTGAKVILQGPCTYKVDSRAGGYLAIGKLTARVEKKGSGVRGQGPEKVASGEQSVASGQWSVASEANPKSEIAKSPISNPQSPIPNPLFTVRTPTATVTDLGTEFGVEVKSDKSTAVCVARGMVEVARDSHVGNVPVRERLVAGEAIYLSSSPGAAPQRMNSHVLRMTMAPDIKAAFDEVKTARHSNQCLTPIGLVASAYGRIWNIDGRLWTQNDRQRAFQVVTDGIFGRGVQKNEGPRSSFDTSAKGLGIRDWRLEEKNIEGKLRKEKSKSANAIPKSQSPLPNPSQFVGLRYGQATQFDRIKVFLGRQMGDGGNWADVPRVFILKKPVDTNQTPPERDFTNWSELPLRQLLGRFSPQPDTNPGMVLEIPLTAFSPDERTGYGWAVGGVPGNGPAGYLSITELRAYGEPVADQETEKGG